MTTAINKTTTAAATTVSENRSTLKIKWKIWQIPSQAVASTDNPTSDTLLCIIALRETFYNTV
jgi:hypothetical protein